VDCKPTGAGSIPALSSSNTTHTMNIVNRLLWDLNKISEFNQYYAVKQEVNEDWLKFRKSLLDEETGELEEALESGDPVAIMDAACDIRYIFAGTLFNIGLERGYLIYNLDQVLPPADAIFSRIYMTSKADPVKLLDRLLKKKSPFMVDFIRPYSILMERLDEISERITGQGSYSIFDLCFQEVHRSNMTKGVYTTLDADRSIKEYAAKGIKVKCELVPDSNGGHFIIIRESDGKIMKGCLYSEPKLGLIMNREESEVVLEESELSDEEIQEVL